MKEKSVGKLTLSILKL